MRPFHETLSPVERIVLTFSLMVGVFMAILDTTIVDIVVPKMIAPLSTDFYGVHYSSISYLIPRDGYLYVGATSEDVGFLSGNTLEGIKRLSEGAIRVCPSLSKAKVFGMLYGYRPATPDEKPIFEVGQNYMVVTGHYRNGVLHAPITAKIALDYLEGNRSQFIDLFSHRRFS